MRRDSATARFTHHARKRSAERGVSSDAVQAALWWGREVRVPTIIHHVLDRKSVAAARREGVDVDRYLGTIVIESARTGAIVTVYRTRSPKRIRR